MRQRGLTTPLSSVLLRPFAPSGAFFISRVAWGRGGPLSGASEGVSHETSSHVQAAFFLCLRMCPGLHQWTMAGRVRGEKMHVRGARLALTMRCLGAAGGKRTVREDGEPAKSSRGGVRPQHNSEGPSGHWNDTVPGRFRPGPFIYMKGTAKEDVSEEQSAHIPPQPLKRPWRKRQRRAASLARSQPGLGRQPQRLKADRPNSAR